MARINYRAWLTLARGLTSAQRGHLKPTDWVRQWLGWYRWPEPPRWMWRW